MPVQSGKIVEDINVQNVANLPHSLKLVVVIADQMQVPEKVSAQEVRLLLCEADFEHGPYDAVEALHIGESVDFAA